MELALINRFFRLKAKDKPAKKERQQNLAQARIGHSYVVKGINTEDIEMKNFLFSLGCFEGEEITVISVLTDNYIINIKDARYSIDKDLAKAILI